MTKALVDVEFLRIDGFSNERYVKIKDHSGNILVGLFHENHMRGESKLIVDILGQKGDDVLVQVPHGGEYGVYDNRTQTPKSDLTVKKQYLTELNLPRKDCAVMQK
jgi:hypothetical protein